jgi:ADP-ribosylglycohydrolase
MKDQYERIKKKKEIINRFKNGEELYKTSPLFNASIQMMSEGVSIYDVFESAIIEMERCHKSFSDHLLQFGSANHLDMFNPK